MSADIAIVTVIQPEFEAMLARLRLPRPDPGTLKQPNQYAWHVGELSPARGGPAYRVVLALVGRPGEISAALAVQETIERWKPAYVVLVGIAGGLPIGGLDKGDVVVSSVIWGYEYGKIADGEFIPRHDFTYPVDTALLTAAQAVPSTWRSDILAAAPRPEHVPKVLFGPVASGDKVVDDLNGAFFVKVRESWPKLQAVEMEGAGAAAAIERVREKKRPVGFVMIRGISDMPRAPGNEAAGSSAAGQTQERDAWTGYASAAAASFTAHLIQETWPIQPAPEGNTASMSVVGALCSPHCSNLTRAHRPNLLFKGRSELLRTIEVTLAAKAQEPGVVVLHGLGGVGKTQTAIQYAYRSADRYRLVWWVRAAERSSLARGYAELAGALGLTVNDTREQELLVSEAREWLQRNAGWLLIFDNVIDSDDIEDYIPAIGAGHVVITSRNAQDWTRIGEALRVEPLLPDEAVELLNSGRAGVDDEAARRLAKELGYLPLALEQARAYVENTQISFSDYLDRFRVSKLRLLRRAHRLADEPSTVAATWEVSFDELHKKSSAGVALLNVCAFLASDDIPATLLGAGGPHVPPELEEAAADPIAFDDAVASLRWYSLIEKNPSALAMHRLVQTVVRERLPVEERMRWAGVAIELAHVPFRRGDDAHNNSNAEELRRLWSIRSRWLPHALAATRHASELGVHRDSTACLLVHIGCHLREYQDPQGAVDALRRALTLYEALGDKARIAVACLHLGGALLDLHDLDGARVQLDRLVEFAKDWAPEHPDHAAVLTLEGRFRWKAGDLKGAISSFEQALEIDITLYGPDDPNVAQAMVNVGAAFHAMGNLKGAMARFKKALPVIEAAYGKDHPSIAVLSRNIGIVAEEDRDFLAALVGFERALVITEGLYGGEGPRVAELEQLLSDTFCKLGRLSEARAAAERAIRIYTARYGAQHVVLIKSLHALAMVLMKMKDLAGAREQLTRVLSLLEASERRSEADLASVLSNLAAVAEEQDDLDAARAYAERAMKIDGASPDRIDPQRKIRRRVLRSIMKKQAKKAEVARGGEADEMSEDEAALYGALLVGDTAEAELDGASLQLIARELIALLRENVVADWAARGSMRAQLSIIVKCALGEHGYPPDKQDEAARNVLEQAEWFTTRWRLS